MKLVGLIGCGRLGRTIAGELAKGTVPGCEIAVVMDSDASLAEKTAGDCSCLCALSVDEVLKKCPDYIVEAASPEVLKGCALKILRTGTDIIALSVGAFCDKKFYDEAAAAAEAGSAHVYLAPGVIGGLDYISAAALLGRLHGTLTYRKHGAGSPVCPPGFEELPDCYEGSLREAFEAYPKHLNIAVSFGLAGGDCPKTDLNNPLIHKRSSRRKRRLI